MVRVPAKWLWNDLLEFRLDLVDGPARSKAGTVANAKDVGVDRKGLFSKGGIEDHIGGLATNAWKCLKLLPRRGDVPAMTLDQRLAERNDIPGLGVEQPDRLNCVSEFLFSKLNHLRRRLNCPEQVPRRDVDARVGRLSRKHDRDEQRIGICEIELGRRRGVCLRESAKEFENLFARHSRSSRARPSRASASSNWSASG